MSKRAPPEQVTLIPIGYWSVNLLPAGSGPEVLILVVAVCVLLFGLPFLPVMSVTLFSWSVFTTGAYFISRRRARAYPARSGSSRLICRGAPGDLRPLENISGEFREPYIASPTAPTKMLPCVIALLVIPLLLLGALLAFGFGSALAFGVMCGEIVGMRVILQEARPLYYRVVPGRLDILECKLFSKKPRRTTSINLSNATMECRYDEGTVYATEGEQRHSVYINSIPHVRQFIKAVFEAAISPHKAGPLPDDALLG